MKKTESEIFEEITQRLNKINGKLKLLNLLTEAKLEYDKNNWQGCQKACEEVLLQHPDNPAALRGLGCVFQSLGDYDKALSYYNKALENSLKKEIEYTLIGSIYYIQEDFDSAINYYNKAIETNDNYDKAYDGKNQSLLEQHLKILDLQDSLIEKNMFK